MADAKDIKYVEVVPVQYGSPLDDIMASVFDVIPVQMQRQAFYVPDKALLMRQRPRTMFSLFGLGQRDPAERYDLLIGDEAVSMYDELLSYDHTKEKDISIPDTVIDWVIHKYYADNPADEVFEFFGRVAQD